MLQDVDTRFIHLGDVPMGNETLLKLEAVVQKMLGTIKELKSSNISLESQIRDKDTKIEELESKLAAVNSDQEDISSRVTSLIDSIEDWEKNDQKDVGAPSELADVSDPVIEPSEVKQEPQLFDEGE